MKRAAAFPYSQVCRERKKKLGDWADVDIVLKSLTGTSRGSTESSVGPKRGKNGTLTRGCKKGRPLLVVAQNTKKGDLVWCAGLLAVELGRRGIGLPNSLEEKGAGKGAKRQQSNLWGSQKDLGGGV